MPGGYIFLSCPLEFGGYLLCVCFTESLQVKFKESDLSESESQVFLSGQVQLAALLLLRIQIRR